MGGIGRSEGLVDSRVVDGREWYRWERELGETDRWETVVVVRGW